MISKLQNFRKSTVQYDDFAAGEVQGDAPPIWIVKFFSRKVNRNIMVICRGLTLSEYIIWKLAKIYSETHEIALFLKKVLGRGSL